MTAEAEATREPPWRSTSGRARSFWRQPEPDSTAMLQAIQVLHDVVTELHSKLHLAEAMRAIADGVVEATCFNAAAINLTLPNGDLEAVAVNGPKAAVDAVLGSLQPIDAWQRMLHEGEHIAGLVYVDHDSALGQDPSLHGWTPPTDLGDDENLWHPLDMLWAPLRSPQGDLVGVLSVDLPEGGHRPDLAQLEILRMFADNAAVAIERAWLVSELERSRAEMQRAAWHDALTGLPNRRQLREREASFASGSHAQVGAIMLDIDRFKSINDDDGHEAGDGVLVTVAERLGRCLRDDDLLVRLGGDEFLILVTGDDVRRTLTSIVDRVRASVAEPMTIAGREYRMRISVGTSHRPTPADLDQLMRDADHAMYADKKPR